MAFLERVWRQAAQLGLRGWVGNTQDGQVEALFEGKAEAVRQMIKWFFSDSSCGVEVHFTSVRQETPRAISLASRLGRRSSADRSLLGNYGRSCLHPLIHLRDWMALRNRSVCTGGYRWLMVRTRRQKRGRARGVMYQMRPVKE